MKVLNACLSVLKDVTLPRDISILCIPIFRCVKVHSKIHSLSLHTHTAPAPRGAINNSSARLSVRPQKPRAQLTGHNAAYQHGKNVGKAAGKIVEAVENEMNRREREETKETALVWPLASPPPV